MASVLPAWQPPDLLGPIVQGINNAGQQFYNANIQPWVQASQGAIDRGARIVASLDPQNKESPYSDAIPDTLLNPPKPQGTTTGTGPRGFGGGPAYGLIEGLRAEMQQELGPLGFSQGDIETALARLQAQIDIGNGDQALSEIRAAIDDHVNRYGQVKNVNEAYDPQIQRLSSLLDPKNPMAMRQDKEYGSIINNADSNFLASREAQLQDLQRSSASKGGGWGGMVSRAASNIEGNRIANTNNLYSTIVQDAAGRLDAARAAKLNDTNRIISGTPYTLGSIPEIGAGVKSAQQGSILDLAGAGVNTGLQAANIGANIVSGTPGTLDSLTGLARGAFGAKK